MSLSINALWPLNLLARVRKALGFAVGLLAAVVSFGFVEVQANAGNYAPQEAGIKAGLVADLNQLIEARRRQAALQWLGAELLAKKAPTQAEAETARVYFDTGERQCAATDARFRNGYDSVERYGRHDGGFCDPQWYRRNMAAALLHVERPKQEVAPATAWLPDSLKSLVRASTKPTDGTEWTVETVAPEAKFELLPKIHRLADLRALQGKVRAELASSENARKSLEGTVAKLIESQFKGMFGGGELLSAWIDPLVAALSEEAVERVSERLKYLPFALPEAAAQLARMDGEQLTIEQPAEQVRQASSMRAALDVLWVNFLRAKGARTDLKPGEAHFEQMGAYVAKREEADREAAVQRAAAARVEFEKVRERMAEVARRARPHVR